MQVSPFATLPSSSMRNDHLLEVANHCNAITATLSKINALSIKLKKNESHLLNLQTRADHCKKAKRGRHKHVNLNEQIAVYKEARAILFKTRENLEKTLIQQEMNFCSFMTPLMATAHKEETPTLPAPALNPPQASITDVSLLTSEESAVDSLPFEISSKSLEQAAAIVAGQITPPETPIDNLDVSVQTAAEQETPPETHVDSLEKAADDQEQEPPFDIPSACLYELEDSQVDDEMQVEAFRAPTPATDDEIDLESQESNMEELSAMLLELEELNASIERQKCSSSESDLKKKKSDKEEIEPHHLAVSVLTNKIHELLDKQERKTVK